jgi:hypothetical protein
MPEVIGIPANLVKSLELLTRLGRKDKYQADAYFFLL